MPTRRLVFRPRLFGFLTALIGIGFFVVLGNWQLGRAAEKRALMEARAAWSSDSPVPLSELDSNLAAQRFRPVVAQGRYLGDRQVLIDNQVHNGQAGYRVLTPLALEGSRELLLVDRGWASGGGDRGAVPNPPPPGGIQMVHGTLDLPPRMALRLGASVVARAGWPLLLLDFDATEVSRQLGQPVLEMALKLSPNETGALVMQGYLGARSGPEKHLSYAVQWFALAAAVAVVFFAVSLERRYDNR